MVLLGGGLGLTTAPATEAIMGSLSADKAGIGSAVNDTTRELGGTLGVAIVGSVFASVYSHRVGSAATLTTLPGDFRSAMGTSMAAAYRVVAQLPAAKAAGVRAAIDHAFLSGMRAGSWIAPGARASRRWAAARWRACPTHSTASRWRRSWGWPR